VSPHARDRAREKRRNQKRQSVLAQRGLDSRRNKQVLGIVLALVVIIGGFVALTFALNKDKTVASSGATAQASGQPSAAPSALAQPVAGCAAPPAALLDKRSAKLPDKKIAAGKTFVATVMTNCGVITMELDGTKAPQTVASFLGLPRAATGPTARVTA
jgi:hypothetical protein